jgi:hypothetical protein
LELRRQEHLGEFKLEQQGIPPDGSEALVAQQSAINRIVRSTVGNYTTLRAKSAALDSRGAYAEICRINPLRIWTEFGEAKRQALRRESGASLSFRPQ